MNAEKKKKKIDGAYYFHTKGNPYFNMAFDNWLFETIQSVTGFPPIILRLYTWGQPSITLGYNQNPDKVVDFSLLDKDVPVIKRITGGRAIYHDETEITFSLIADLQIFPSHIQSLSKTNQLISETVIQVLESVGVESRLTKKSDASFIIPAGKNKKSCFGSYSRYEIFVSWGKIVAGAQRRKSDFFIHQGSIKINGICDCPAIGQNKESVSHSGMGGRDNSYIYTINQFRDLFPDTFSRKLGVIFNKQALDSKSYRAIELLAEKYKENIK